MRYGDHDVTLREQHLFAQLLEPGARLFPLFLGLRRGFREVDLRLLARNGANPRGASWTAAVIPEDPFHAGVGIALAHRLEEKRSV